MKYKWLVPVLAAALLAGCGAVSTVMLETPESALLATPSPTASTASVSSYLPVTPLTELSMKNYDEITFCTHNSIIPKVAAYGYYSVKENGMWGLVRSDGTEVLPCRAYEPVTQCWRGNAWHWNVDMNTMSIDEYYSYDESLKDADAYGLCDGHGGMSNQFVIYDGNQKLYQLYNGVGTASLAPMDSTVSAYFGDILPARTATLVKSSDFDWYDTHEEDRSAFFVFLDGTPLNEDHYDAVGWFFDSSLAPAEKDGKWAYIDRQGHAVTDYIYSSVTSDSDVANYLLGGYAAICHNGRWGLLNSDGIEVLPCQYEGVLWDGNVLWCKEYDVWYAYSLNTVTSLTRWPGIQPDITRLELPSSIVAPDTAVGLDSPDTYFADADHGLVLRAGPGTDHDKLDVIPKDTSIRALACSSAAANWMLTEYNGQYGWVCTDYLR